MNVQETIDLGNGHQLEIPLNDIGPIIEAVAQRDLLDAATTARLIAVLAASLTRRIKADEPPSLTALMERVTEENRHAAVETGPAVGNEAW